MGMNVGSDSGEVEIISAINTTPLVDVMLVLLIIFLITIPAITQSVAVNLPEEKNIVTQTKPEKILIPVSNDGNIYRNPQAIPQPEALFARLKGAAVKIRQP